MEYALSIGITLLFLIMFILTQSKMREHSHKTLGESDYENAVNDFTASLPIPEEGGAKLDSKKFISAIKRVSAKTKRYSGRSELAKEFEKCFEQNEKEISLLLNQKYDGITKLPSVSKESRAVRLARFSLEHSEFLFTEDRTEMLISAQNKIRSMTVAEIIALRTVYFYVLLEKLHFLCGKMDYLMKAEKLAQKYVANADSLNNSPKFRRLRKSKLFLSLCAANIEVDEYTKTYFDALPRTLEELKRYINNIFLSVHCVSLYDFSVHYAPNEILNVYENFVCAPPVCKENFLRLLSRLSDRENLDEYGFSVRLARYIDAAKLNGAGAAAFKTAGRRFSIFNQNFVLIKQSANMVMLAAALLSRDKMQLYFGETSSKKKKSIILNAKFDNTFGKIYQKYTVNYGVSIIDNKLSVNAELPENVTEGIVYFIHNGVKHRLCIRQNDNLSEGGTVIRLGDTVLHGVEQIVLGEIPLNITVTLPNKEITD